jgi:hypothetical protein
MNRLARALVLALVGCGGAKAASTPPSNKATGETPPPASTDLPRCYPYVPAADGSCPTSCETRDTCAGSRGPGDLAKNGWPLDCIGGECVPLSPEHVHGQP